MVPTGGRDCAAVSDRLFAEPYRFDFFQAVRLLERLARAHSASQLPRRESPVGGDQAPHQEPVRFRALPSHGFPAGAAAAIRKTHAPDSETATESAPPEMTVTFLGLTGPQGALPAHYTTLLLDRVRAKDFALRDFLDLFNHRTISLFYRAWEKYRFPIAYERSQPAATEADEDLFTRVLYSMVGLGTGGLRRRVDFDDEAFLFYGGLFAHYPRSAISLELMLGNYFEMPVQVKQFYGQWLYLRAEDWSLLPTAASPQGMNCRLGRDVVVGERVWDVESKFRVRLGPVSYAQFRRFFPSGDALRPLCQLVRTYVGPHLDFDVQPVLLGAEVPWCRLGGDGDVSRLGWNTWIRSHAFDRHVDDAVFSLEV